MAKKRLRGIIHGFVACAMLVSIAPSSGSVSSLWSTAMPAAFAEPLSPAAAPSPAPAASPGWPKSIPNPASLPPTPTGRPSATPTLSPTETIPGAEKPPPTLPPPPSRQVPLEVAIPGTNPPLTMTVPPPPIPTLVPIPTAAPAATPRPAPTATPTPVIVDRATIHPETGGVARTRDGKVKIEFPPGAVSAAARVAITPLGDRAPRGQLDWIPFAVSVDVRDSSDRYVGSFQRPVTVEITYDEEAVRGLSKPTLALYSYDETARQWQKLPSVVSFEERAIMATTTHFSPISYWGEPFISMPAAVNSFETDLFNLSASFSYPLAVLPGPNGLQPKLSLSYSSASVDEMKSELSRGSWVGIGWHLGLGSISYDPKKEKFFLNLNGVSDELILGADDYYHTKKESFLRIVKRVVGYDWKWRNDVYWEVWDRSGTYYRFGARSDSNIWDWTPIEDGTHRGVDGSRHFWTNWDNNPNPNEGGHWDYVRTYNRWDLDYVRDTTNNVMEVTYRGTRDQISVSARTCTWLQGDNICFQEHDGSPDAYDVSSYPYEIRYSTNDVGGPRALVRFLLAPRSDVPSGVQVRDTHRLNAVEVRYGPDAVSLARKYVFGYFNSSTQLRLTSITEYAADGVSALPPMGFSYEDKAVKIIGEQEDYTRPRLAGMANGYGGAVTYAYAVTTPGAGYWSRQLVYTRTVADGLGGSGTYTYTYTGDRYYCDGCNTQEAEFSGVNLVVATDPAGNVSHHRFHQGTGGTVNREDGSGIADTVGLEGKPYEEDWHDGVGSRRKAVLSTWTAQPLPGDSTAIRVVQVFQTTDFADGEASYVTYRYDAYGNRTHSYQYGASDPAISDQAWYRIDMQSFTPNTARWIVNKPAATVVYSNDGNGVPVIATLGYTSYDRQEDGTLRDWAAMPLTGTLAAVLDRHDTVLPASVEQYYHDEYGNRVATLDPNGHYSYRVLDNLYHSLPLWEVNALGQTTTYDWDYRLAKPLAVMAPSGSRTTYEYDPFGRTTRTWRSNGAGDLELVATLRYTDTASPMVVSLSTPTDSGGLRHAWRFYDGLGRLAQEYADEVGGKSLTNIHYNSRGLKAWQSVPRLAQAGGSFSSVEWNDISKPHAEYLYDALGRQTMVTHPDGAYQQTSYSGRTRTEFDENGHSTVYEHDAFGRLTAVTERTGTALPFVNYATTRYSYDVLDNLRFVTDAVGNSTEMRYGGRGLKTTMFDPDMGNWLYQYDPVGNVIGQTDALSHTIVFTYDPLNRLVGKQSGGMTIASYDYDRSHGGGSYGIGHRTTMTDTTGTTRWYYDARGRLSQEAKTIAGQTYQTTYTYNAFDQVRTTTLPDGEVTTSTYDIAGRQSGLASSLGGTQYLAGATYNVQGQVKQLTLANGAIQTTYGYHGYSFGGIGTAGDNPAPELTNLGRLWEIATTAGGTTKQQLRLRYDPAGNIRYLDNLAGASPSAMQYLYDDLNRLTGAWPVSGNGHSEGFGYDQIGNIITATQGSTAKSYVYEGRGPHAVKAITGSGPALYDYDLNGNMTAGAGRTIAWDVENRPARVVSGTNAADHYYDGDGNLARKVASAATFADDFRTRRDGDWTYSANQTVPYSESGQYMVMSAPTYPPAAFFRNAYSVTSGSSVQFDVRFSDANSLLTIVLEDAYGNYCGLSEYNSKFYENCNDGLGYTGEYVAPASANTWYVVTFAVDDAAGFRITVWQRDDPLAAATSTVSMTGAAGHSWRFRHGALLNGYDYMANYAEIGPSGQVIYAGNQYEKNLTTGEITKYYYANGRRIAMRKGSSVYYLLADHLGSTMAVLDSAGNVVSESLYYSFGGSRASTGAIQTDRLYTGQQLEAAIGLYNYGARWYDAWLGRFISADTIVPNPRNPQDLNRYAYSRNNPLRFTDPTGHVVADFAEGGGPPSLDDSEPPDEINMPDLEQTCLPSLPCSTNMSEENSSWLAWLWQTAPAGPFSLALPGAVFQMGGESSSSDEARSGSGGGGGGAPPSREPERLRKGNEAHYDELNGGKGKGLPSKLRDMFKDTIFRFARRGQKGVDVYVESGKHPSEYPGATWPAGSNRGEFRPDTSSGSSRYLRDVRSGKLPPGTTPLFYDPNALSVRIG